MTFTFVTAMDEVLRLALLPAPVPRADLAPEAANGAAADAPPADAEVTAPDDDDDDALAVGEHRRTPGAREGGTPPLADVTRGDETRRWVDPGR
jgi:hypothetical protein